MTIAYLKAGHAIGNGPMRSIPQTINGHGEDIEVSFFRCDMGILENLWHLLHFLAEAMASILKVGQKYPCRRALWARDYP